MGEISDPQNTENGHPVLQLVQTTPSGTEGLDSPKIPHTHAVWLEMIESAEKTLDIGQFYIIDKRVSDLGSGQGRLAPVLEAVKAAAERGVAVRIIVDSGFAARYDKDWKDLHEKEGIEVRQINFDNLTGGILHAKYFLVDDCEAFVGSQNFDWRSLEHIVELGVRVRVPQVARAMSRMFETDWQIAGGDSDFRAPATSVSESLPVKTNYSGEDVEVDVAFSPKGWLPDERDWDLPKIIALIDSAQNEVRLQVMSYATSDEHGNPEFWGELDNALRRAASRNVDVRILLGDWADEAQLAAIRSLHLSPNLLARMVTIPDSEVGKIDHARVIHSKFLSVDSERSWLGTSNWSRGYFYSSRNLGIVVSGRSFATDLDELFDRLWNSNYSYNVMPGPLRDVINQVRICRNSGETPIVVFDLDDTIFTTRDRTFRILQEFGQDYSDAYPNFQRVLARANANDMRYGIEPTLKNLRVDNAPLAKSLSEYWWDRFFQDEYVAYDLPNPGAVEFVNECYSNGAVIYYCTGRHYRRPRSFHATSDNAALKDAPSEGMERGTIKALLNRGFPLASGRAILHLKSSFHQHDVEFKHIDALPKIRELNGRVIATFENEPENANIFLEAFPEAMHFWLQTQHRPDAKAPDPRLVRIHDFFTHGSPQP